MRENVFEYLVDYGFNKDELSGFLKINEKLFFANLDNIKDNLTFLKNKELNDQEIIEVIKKECFLLTISLKKKELLDEIYYNIFNKEELKQLIINYPTCYVVNPLELKELIDYIIEKGYDLKNSIIKYPYILSYDIEYLKSII